MKKRITIAIMLIVLILLFAGLFLFRNPIGIEKPARSGEEIIISLETPHPYPNSKDGRVLVWSETIEHPGAKSLRIHFNRIDILGRFELPTLYEEVNYGECDLNASLGYTREMVDKNTIIQKQMVEESDKGEISAGVIEIIKCGMVQEKKEFTPQELFDNHQNWAEGDFLAVKNSDGIVVDIIHGESYGKFDEEELYYLKEDVWSNTYYGSDSITLELYADETENGFGLSVDRYITGFAETQKLENPI